MPLQPEIAVILEQTVRAFCLDFLTHPYLCYTEHGLHALFYTKFYNALSPEQRYTIWNNQKVCVIQKEYPTAGLSGKPRRQHWDIAVVATPPQSLGSKRPGYDYLRLAAIVEFGLNEAKEHLQDDIERICHEDANADKGYIVHLYRLTSAGQKFSGRDWSSESAHIFPKEGVRELVGNKPATVYYGIWDGDGKYETGLWCITEGATTRVQ
jgi:hypothetical protein